MRPTVKYVVVTPVKDEEKYLQFTVESMVNQTIRPLHWAIVDDGSTDKTPEIIKACAEKHPWIKGVYGKDQGQRMPGIRHIRAFYQGLSALDAKGCDFIVKLDGDLSFEKDYFERCFMRFRENPKLGIGGGVILNVVADKLVPEKHPHFHVRGATKIYRRECWDAIGGIVVSQCYDTVDEVRANMMGYQTESFSEISLVHHRYTGNAYGKWGSSVKNGMANYLSGYHPLFMISKCAKRFLRRPYSIDAFGLAYGFTKGYAKKIPRAVDLETMRYLRRQQLRRLAFLPSIWK
jgi:glycosyltransferase involved in cell wall biosynthesis